MPDCSRCAAPVEGKELCLLCERPLCGGCWQLFGVCREVACTRLEASLVSARAEWEERRSSAFEVTEVTPSALVDYREWEVTCWPEEFGCRARITCTELETTLVGRRARRLGWSDDQIEAAIRLAVARDLRRIRESGDGSVTVLVRANDLYDASGM